MVRPDDDTSELDLCSVLDAYLDALHAGRTEEQQTLLADHPQLATAFQCLEAVEAFVQGASDQTPSESIHSAQTMQPSGARPRANEQADATWIAGPMSFGDYEVIDEVGRGGMGVIYRARQKSLDRLVAIKMILASQLASEEQVERFHAEARAAAKLRHPNIVDVHEAGQLHGQHYIVMEFMEGQSLALRLEKGPLAAEVAAEYVAAVARAVDHLHRHGIVHRDLKPSNILFDAAGHPHVTDFGLAKILESDSQLTTSGAVVGTPSYMAPEQAAGRTREVGPLADVYSLGAILYCTLTGEPPFHAESPLDTLVQVLEREPRLPRQINPNVPADLEWICLRCIEKAPEARYASAAALADDLDRFLKGDVVEARPPNWATRLKRWSRREPALTSRLALLALSSAIELANYVRGTKPLDYLLDMLLILFVWAAASVVFQRMLTKEWWPTTARFAWAGADTLLVTAVLVVADAFETPLVVIYPAMIAASGLWFYQRLVWFVTAMSVASYIGLWVYWHVSGRLLAELPYRHVLTLIVLLVMGFVVAYQVKRVRVLSRHYEHRTLP